MKTTYQHTSNNFKTTHQHASRADRKAHRKQIKREKYEKAHDSRYYRMREIVKDVQDVNEPFESPVTSKSRKQLYEIDPYRGSRSNTAIFTFFAWEQYPYVEKNMNTSRWGSSNPFKTCTINGKTFNIHDDDEDWEIETDLHGDDNDESWYSSESDDDFYVEYFDSDY